MKNEYQLRMEENIKALARLPYKPSEAANISSLPSCRDTAVTFVACPVCGHEINSTHMQRDGDQEMCPTCMEGMLD